jgi:excisionase family DNA binding protein
MTMVLKGNLNSLRHRDSVGVVTDQPGGSARKSGAVTDGRLLTVKQAAEKCQVSDRLLRRMIKAGELPVIRFGKAVRIHPKHLGL